jgi:uncharacterized protein YgfB (UPF0149 family)
MTESQIPDFDSIEQMLAAAGASWEASEAHGAFCGRACLSGAASIRLWIADLLGNPDGADVLAGERAAALERLAATALLSLEAGDMGFNLLLPDDGTSLTLRTAGLADWCHGFMHGLVAAGGADAGPQEDALEAEVVGEILDDFSEITKAGAAADEGEVSEAAFVELVEYVRVSAQLVYDETAAVRQTVSTGGNA